MNKLLSLTAVLLATSVAAFANPVTPSGTFGTLSDATWGGTGIANDAAMYTTFDVGHDSITLGLSATPRYSAPAFANNGAGTYYPSTGVISGKSLWNFDYYVSVTGGNFGGYSFKLFYGTDASSLLSFDPVALANADGGKAVTANTRENSENLVWFLPGFDANASGIYSFELVAYTANGDTLGSTAINVNVGGGAVPDTASTVMLLGLGLLGMAVYSHRQLRPQATK